jgi:hypothetical protein
LLRSVETACCLQFHSVLVPSTTSVIASDFLTGDLIGIIVALSIVLITYC